jgi:hypothetical protein
VTSLHAPASDPYADPYAAIFASPGECLPAGRPSRSSARCTFGTPGARYAIRGTVTGPKMLDSVRPWPRSARVRQTPSGPATRASRGSAAATANR